MVVLLLILLGILTLCLALSAFIFYNRLDLLFRPIPKDFDSAITQGMQTAQIPGAAVLFISKGQVESAKGYGIADIETGRMVTPNTMFTIASISKTVTATALMMSTSPT
jgi:CubicO group peptidase (beta-lactamase class C family)